MFPYGGTCLIWEVTDLQVLSPYFSDDDDKQGFCVFPGKALHASKRRSIHGLAFLPEAAATQEGPEAIRPSLYAEDNSWSQHVRLHLRDIIGTDPPIFSERMYKVASTAGECAICIVIDRGHHPTSDAMLSWSPSLSTSTFWSGLDDLNYCRLNYMIIKHSSLAEHHRWSEWEFQSHSEVKQDSNLTPKKERNDGLVLQNLSWESKTLLSLLCTAS
jgi:hypothetical protein